MDDAENLSSVALAPVISSLCVYFDSTFNTHQVLWEALSPFCSFMLSLDYYSSLNTIYLFLFALSNILGKKSIYETRK